MGLFSKKRQLSSMDSEAEKPTLPEFPDIPENFENEGNESTYESTIADIKNEVSKNDDDFEIPVRRPLIRPNMANQSSVEDNKFDDFPKAPAFDEEKPLFIKINQYKDALKHLEELKTKIEDAENVLRELESVREEEEKKIEQWKKDLHSVKEKLLSIDKSLFEV